MYGTVCKQIRYVNGILKGSLKYQTGKLLNGQIVYLLTFFLLSGVSQASTIVAKAVKIMN